MIASKSRLRYCSFSSFREGYRPLPKRHIDILKKNNPPSAGRTSPQYPQRGRIRDDDYLPPSLPEASANSLPKMCQKLLRRPPTLADAHRRQKSSPKAGALPSCATPHKLLLCIDLGRHVLGAQDPNCAKSNLPCRPQPRGRSRFDDHASPRDAGGVGPPLWTVLDLREQASTARADSILSLPDPTDAPYTRSASRAASTRSSRNGARRRRTPVAS